MNDSMTLSQLQEKFTHCLLDNSQTAESLPLDETISSNNKRLDIYRNNVFYSLKNALADLYPVVKKLTGEDYFNGTAIAYLKQHPPTQAAMVYFGGTFPEFLGQFEFSKQHGWLAEVARLELACHQSYHAADINPLDHALLSSISPEKLADMQVILHPSLHLINSPYPVYRIWLANQDGGENDEAIDLDSGGEMLCVYRPEYDVLIKPVDEGTYTFLSTLSQGDNLGTAIVNAVTTDPDFAADKVLADYLRDNIFENIIEVR